MKIRLSRRGATDAEAEPTGKLRHRSGRVRTAMWVSVLAIAGGLFAAGCGMQPTFTPQPAPQVTAQGWLNGEPPPREQWAGKVLVLHAWATY